MRFLSMIFLIVLVSQIPQILLLTQANQTQTQQIDNSAYYRLTNSYAGPGKSLSISGPNRAVVMADTAESNDQLWKLTPTSDGKYRIVNVTAGDGKSLDSMISNGQYIVGMGNTGRYTGQFWTLSPLGAGKYRLTNDFAGATKSLDNRMSDGQYSVAMGDTGNYSGQFWTLTRSTTMVSVNVPYVTQPSTQILVTDPTNSIDVTPTRSSTRSTSEGDPLVIREIWNENMIPSGGGTMLCSADLRAGLSDRCGFTKADWVGRHQVNTTCEKGFYDPIWGGTCWDFPLDDKKGQWVRGTTPITADDALWRAPIESTARAIFVKKTAAAWDCNGKEGEFWDGYKLGGCWKCPESHPRRTGNHVAESNACASSLNETTRAVFLKYNGCSKPDPGAMKLAGKRMPGKPFLQLGSGCYACPNSDEQGNILVTSRNGNPISGDAYANNHGCTILFKWKPPVFPEPGMAGLLGVKEVLFEDLIFDNWEILTAYLTEIAKEKGYQPGTSESLQYIGQQWQEIAKAPYKSATLSNFVFAMLENAAATDEAKRTPAQKLLVGSVQEYVRLRRKFIAEQALAMYDAWSAYDQKQRELRAQSRLETIGYDYGTVPMDFQAAAGAGFGLAAAGAGVAGAIAGYNKYALVLAKTAKEAADKARIANAGTSAKEIDSAAREAFNEVYHLRRMGNVMSAIKELRLLTLAGQVAVVGPAVLIEIVGLILQSIAIDQFIQIQEARDKLENAVTEAEKTVDLKKLLAAPNGTDELAYFWSKAMDKPTQQEDPQVVAKAAAAMALAKQNGYKVSGGE